MLLYVGSFSNLLTCARCQCNTSKLLLLSGQRSRAVFGSRDQNDLQSPLEFLGRAGSSVSPVALKVLTFSRGEKLTSDLSWRRTQHAALPCHRAAGAAG